MGNTWNKVTHPREENENGAVLKSGQDVEKEPESADQESGPVVTAVDKSNSVTDDVPVLTEEQKKIIVETWRIVEKDIAQVGVITFIGLFETHPGVQQVFMPFNGLKMDELKQSKTLRAHALRVMGFVQKAVARLEEPEKLDNLLKDNGKKHVHYGATKDYIVFVGPQFISAIRPTLEDQWNEEVQMAWESLFHYITYVMGNSMEEEMKSGLNETVGSRS